MATLRTVTVGPVSGTYGSLEAAEAAEQGDISVSTGSDEYVVFECEDFDDSTSAGLGSGWTTEAPDNYVLIRPESGAKHDGRARDVSGSGYALQGIALTNPCGHVIIEDVVLYDSTTSGGATVVHLTVGSFSSGDFVTLRRCIIHDKQASATVKYDISASQANLNLTMENCIVYGNNRPIDGRAAATCVLNHCTFYGGSALGPILDSSCEANNCYSGGHTSEDWWTGGSAPSGDYNASEDTTATTDYTNGIGSLTASSQFNNASIGTSADFRLKSGADLIDAGTTGTGVTDDIIGTARDGSPDIGASEFASGASTIEGSVSFGVTAGASFTGDAVGEGAVSYAVTIATTVAGDAVGEGSLTMATTASIAFDSEVSIEAATSLATVMAMSLAADAVGEGAASMPVVAGFDTSAQADAEGATSLAATMGAQFAGGTLQEASVALSASPSITFAGDISIEAALSIATTLALVVAADATAEGVTSIDVTPALSFAGDAVAEDSVTFGATASITFVGDVVAAGAVEASVSFTASPDITIAADAALSADLALAVLTALNVDANALAEGSVTLSAIAGLTIVGGGEYDVDLSLATVTGITIDGTQVLISGEVADGRTIFVRLEARTIYVDAENRTIVVEEV